MHRVCGEYISTESKPFLTSLGVDLKSVSRITQLQISAPNGTLLRSKLDSGGIGISRFELDRQLFQLALNAGVCIQTETQIDEVLDRTSKYELRAAGQAQATARLVISAHGKRSNLDRYWNRTFFSQRSPYVGVKYHVRSDFPKDTIALHNFKNGYCGFSAVENDLYCLCYLVARSELKAAGSVETLERKNLHQNPFLKSIWETSTFVWDQPLVINEISFAPKSRIENACLQLGDAAGMIAPLCGNGMSMALHSAMLVHQAIQEAGIEHPSLIFKHYDRAWKKQFKWRLLAGRTIQGMFGSTWTTNMVVSALKHTPQITRGIIRLTHGSPF